MADQRQIGFCPCPKTARAIDAERKRLAKECGKGARVGKAEAVRSLIVKAMEPVDAT